MGDKPTNSGEEQEFRQRADHLKTLGLDTYGADNRPARRNKTGTYSRIIKSLRIIFPLIALSLILLLFSWHRIESTPAIQPIEPLETKAQKGKAPIIGKNELTNPRFESTDNKGNPYIVTADRALQGQSEEDDLIVLENPVADIALEDGNWLAVKSNQSDFRQESQKLTLKGNVEIFHDEGYTLQTELLNVDMKEGTARNMVDVHIQGPKGELDAKGLNADRENGILIFKGPAKMTLNGGGL